MTPGAIIDALLVKRGIAPAERDILLRPDFGRDLHEASAMRGMPEAVARIRKAMESGERITVFGDYDADGVPATALMVRGFKRLGIEVNPIIPTRESGYGLTPEAVEAVKKAGTNLLITVDNGTVSKDEVAELKAAGIDTIVVDHHEPQEGHMADAAIAIINPKQDGCPYPFRELCGCALAWKLMGCLYAETGGPVGQLKWDLDLVALSTVADMMPLVGENRVLVAYGMRVMRKSRNLGLGALARAAGLELADLTPGRVSFQMAPRINAPSRMHSETVDGENAALALLVSQDAAEATRLAGYLSDRNAERQELVERHIEEALVQAEGMEDALCLVVYGESWSSGVIGLVAGRLLERFRRPVIALAREGGSVKGSVRSVEGVSAVEMLAAGGSFLKRYGGHAKAGGLTMKEGASIEGFANAADAFVRAGGWDEARLRRASERQPDLNVALSDITLELADALAELEPFGIGWPSPLFEARCRLAAPRKVGRDGKHLSCLLDDGTVSVKAIAFGQGDAPVAEGRECDVAFTVEADEWNGARRVSCQVQRIEPAA